jgi:hypothetical protein
MESQTRNVLTGGFDVTERSVPLERIVSGGPGKDDIPAIDEPRFLSAGQADFLADDDLVIGVVGTTTAKAYPLRILTWHEVVNDHLDDTAVAVTFCPLTASALVFDRRIDGREHSFGVSGWLYENNVLMYDRATDSLWSQLGGGAVAGVATGTQLVHVASLRTSWQSWKEAHPATLVLSPDSGVRRDYARNPYRLYELSGSPMFEPARLDARVQAKELVLGVSVGSERKAYPFIELEVAGVRSITDRVGDHDITVHFDGQNAYATSTGGVVDAFMVYWFAWSVFHPATDIWTAARASSRIPDSVEISGSNAVVREIDSYWTSMGTGFGIGVGGDDHSNSGLFVISGTVENVSNASLRRIELKFELLDGRGATVYAEQGVNRLAEDNLMLSPADLAAKDAEEVAMVAPGASDAFRMIFLGNEVPKFTRSRVSVIATR